jgi:dCMP deaminase
MLNNSIPKKAVVKRVIFEDLSPREQVFMLNARNTASLSKDSQTKHGLLLVLDNNIVATGYNGFPAGADDANLPTTRPEKYPYIVHAEINAICNAARRGVSIEGATAYCTGECCLECFKALLQCGVRNFVVGNRGHTKKDDHEKYLRYFSDWYGCSITYVIDFPEDDFNDNYLRVTTKNPEQPAKRGDPVYDVKTGEMVGTVAVPAVEIVDWVLKIGGKTIGKIISYDLNIERDMANRYPYEYTNHPVITFKANIESPRN